MGGQAHTAMALPMSDRKPLRTLVMLEYSMQKSYSCDIFFKNGGLRKAPAQHNWWVFLFLGDSLVAGMRMRNVWRRGHINKRWGVKRMIRANLMLLSMFLIGMIFGNNLIAASAGTLLVIKLVKLPSLLGVVERHCLEWGLLFLLIAVMVPFAQEKVGFKEMVTSFTSPVGLVAILGGTLATYICGQGVALLHWHPEVMVGLVIGTVLGVALLKGIPVGPLAAAGLTAVILNLFGLNKK